MELEEGEIAENLFWVICPDYARVYRITTENQQLIRNLIHLHNPALVVTPIW